MSRLSWVAVAVLGVGLLLNAAGHRYSVTVDRGTILRVDHLTGRVAVVAPGMVTHTQWIDVVAPPRTAAQLEHYAQELEAASDAAAK